MDDGPGSPPPEPPAPHRSLSSFTFCQHDGSSPHRQPDHITLHTAAPAEPVKASPIGDHLCDRPSRPGKDERSQLEAMTTMSSDLIDKTVAPFLLEHTKSQYSPVTKLQQLEASRRKVPNSKFCYRHRPDSKCRRAADEAKMVMIQRELDKLPPADQQAITHVWSVFSAAPAKLRELMLQGVLSQLCFPQLSLVSREAHEALKIDFTAALPPELSQKILCYLDTVSLTKAAQVSRRWRDLADDDSVWVLMCEQHVNRKCTKCGWGLPLLEKKRLRDWTRAQQLAKSNAEAGSDQAGDGATQGSTTAAKTPAKRDAGSVGESVADTSKRRCTGTGLGSPTPELEEERKFRSWKAVYRDRWQVGANWKYGRCTIDTLKSASIDGAVAHSNGVTCLQLSADDTMIATGSYDNFIKIWNIETGQEIRILRGHTRGIRALQFDDCKVISGSLDSTVKVWDWVKGECVCDLAGHTDGVISVHCEGSMLASGSIDRTIRILNFESREVFCLKGHTDWVNSVRLDMKSRTLLSASDDTTIKLWDLDTRQILRTLEGHIGHVQQVLPLPPDFEFDDVGLARAESCSYDNTDAMSVSSSGRGEAPGNETPTLAVAQPHMLYGGSQTAGTGLAGTYASLSTPPHDVEDPALLRELYYGPGSVSQDPKRPLPPRYLVSAGLDSTIRLWDSLTGRTLKPFFGHVEGVWALAGNHMRIISGANDGLLKCWDPRTGRCERTFAGPRGPIMSVSMSDSRMACGSEDGEVRIYSFNKGDMGVGWPGPGGNQSGSTSSPPRLVGSVESI